MKAYAITGIATVATLTAAGAEAATVTQYTFDNTAVTTVPYTADTGTGTATVSGVGTVSFPAGNGSARALSANGWTVGGYFQLTSSTTGFQDITVTYDQAGSNTGPRDFAFSYSTNGTTFTDFGTYAVPVGSFNTTVPITTNSFSFNLSAIDSIENLSTVTFRIRDTSTTSINGGTVASGGTGRIDTFTVSGTAIPSTPEPASLAALGLAGLGLVRRQRRQA